MYQKNSFFFNKFKLTFDRVVRKVFLNPVFERFKEGKKMYLK